jgi:hypothetical protein
MKISRHGSKRIKKRIGLPKRAHLRHIQMVLNLGNKVAETTKDGFNMIYNNFLYIFAHLENNEPILVTTYEEPKDWIQMSTFKSKKK